MFTLHILFLYLKQITMTQRERPHSLTEIPLHRTLSSGLTPDRTHRRIGLFINPFLVVCSAAKPPDASPALNHSPRGPLERFLSYIHPLLLLPSPPPVIDWGLSSSHLEKASYRFDLWARIYITLHSAFCLSVVTGFGSKVLLT